MFDVRLRMFGEAGTKGRVLTTSSLVASVQESGVASVKFSVSERVAGRLAAPFLVGVEFSTGGAYAQPRNGLFIVTEEGSDSADASQTVGFTAAPFVPWLLEGMHQRMRAYPGGRYTGPKIEWSNVTPGRILRSLIDYGKSDLGQAPMLTVDFTATTDSAGAAWTSAERWSPEFPKRTPILSILDAHTDAGLVDWWTEGTKLRIFRPGVGTLRPNVKLGGPGFQRMPVTRQYQGQFNFLTIFAEDGARYYENPGADSTYGTRDMTATLSGVKLADADRIVAPMLVEGRTPKRELSYEWTPAGSLPVPWVDFQVGDGVMARDRDGWTEQRVLGITVSKSESVTVRATVGAKLLNRLKRAVQKIEGGSLGQLTGGTGVTVPVVPPAKSAAPMAPDGLRVTSNTATWGEDGTARTSIGFAWNEVTQTTELADVDGVTYEVWGRKASEASARLTVTDALELTVDGWEADVARYVKVRARDREGRTSAFSSEIAVTPVSPASIVPKAPTGLTVVSNTAAFLADGRAVATVKVSWTGVTLSTDDVPVDIAEYEVSGGVETQRVTGTTASFTVPTGSTVGVRVSAKTTLGVWGDPTPVLNVTGAAPAGLSAAPSAPILTAGMGGVAYRFDGLSSTGAAMPTGFSRVVVDTAPASSGPWTAQGATLASAGGGSVSAAVGTEVFVRFRAFDTLGRAMGTSVTRSATAAGVPVSELPQEIIDAIADATSTADNAWDAASVAVTGTVLEYASNTSETVAPTSGWSTTPPTRTPGKFIWQRTKITYGSGSTTTTSAVLLTGNTGGAGAPGNPGAPGQPGAPGDPGTDGVSVTSVQVYYRTTAAGAAAPAKPTAAAPPAPWTATEPAYAPGVDLWAVTRVGFSNATYSYTAVSKVSAYTAAQAAMTTADGKNRVLVSVATPPASSLVTAGDQWLQLDAAGTSIIAIKTWDGTGWNERPLWASSVIAAESITAPLIKAGEIEVNHVSPSFGDTLDLQGNGTINLIAGQVDANVESLNDQQLVLDTHDTQIVAAQAAADAASNGASEASIAAAAAQAAAEAAQGGVDKLALALTLTATDLRLSRPGDPVALHMANGNISIRRNNVAQTWWDEQQMIVPKLKATQVIVGQTVITEGNGRTTWQRL